MSGKKNAEDQNSIKGSIEWGLVVSSALYILLGIVLLKFPDQSLRTVCYFFGGVTLVYGVIRIVTYFLEKRQGILFLTDVIVGIILTGIGIFLLVTPEVVISIIPFIIGLLILFHSVMKIQRAFQLKRVNYDKWWSMLVLSLITAALGALIIYNPFKTVSMMVMAIGIVLMIDGAINLISIFFTAHTVKKMTKIIDETTGTVEEVEIDVVDNNDIV